MRSYLAQIYSLQLKLMSLNQTHTWGEESLKYSKARAQHEKSQQSGGQRGTFGQVKFMGNVTWQDIECMTGQRSTFYHVKFMENVTWQASRDIECIKFCAKVQISLFICAIITPYFVQQTFSVDYFVCTVLDAKENSHKLFELFINAVKIFPHRLELVGW